jgi:hypothetical protein
MPTNKIWMNCLWKNHYNVSELDEDLCEEASEANSSSHQTKKYGKRLWKSGMTHQLQGI